MTLDLVIRGGTVVDGTGSPAWTADVAVHDGRIVEIGRVDTTAERCIDVDGLVVSPGFIDLHTHYDAQVFWDPTLSPSPLHGVTTVVGGNCGFSIAPLSGDPADGEYLMQMLARVEGMPLASLREGVPWDWRTTADYLERLEGSLLPNAGFLVGHSALRRAVLHEEATERSATQDEIRAMCELLAAGLTAGGLGFSSTWSTSHNDHTGRPVPSRYATREELLALCSVVGEHPGTTLEFIPAVGRFDETIFELMADMSAVANRPLNWNLLQVYAKSWNLVEHQLRGGDVAEQRGGKVVALTLPDSFRTRLNFTSGFILDVLPGWDRLMALSPEEKLGQLRDPATRAEWDAMAQTMEGPLRSVAHWASYVLLETFSPDTRPFEGRSVGEVATELGRSAWDTLAWIVVADDLRTVIANPDRGQDEATWRRRVEVWRDPRAIVGASDAGAHLDMVDSFSYCTTMLAKAVREHDLLPLEEAVHHLTQRPANLYGLRDRGVLRAGAHADLVVFDPTIIGPEPVHTRFDLPAGAGRVYGGAEGVHHVIVGGVPCVEGHKLLAARPGTVLRSGRDTDTVTARPAGG